MNGASAASPIMTPATPAVIATLAGSSPTPPAELAWPETLPAAGMV
jgi:hypothetical protein